ncbi:hypothetical protein ACQ26G_001561 [Yersinia enterocolitica]|nr:hypothetical protein [Yersinia enterocolitica]HEI6738443.1 hypothetical protein [Yersinia enterocolitica]HEI6832161.1 hypothetical protein [Yersinia enterocolitica]
MKDYKESLMAGIKAAKEAAKNKEEIKMVLKGVADQVEAISENKATFGLGKFTKKTKNVNAFGVIIDLMNTPIEKYEALAIWDRDGKDGIEIAEWSEDEFGYPCMVKFSGQKLFCSDKAELENSLAELLKGVKTGEAILAKIEKYNRQNNSTE